MTKYRISVFKILEILGINALFRFLNRNKVLILWYHGICDDDFNLLSGYDERHIQKSRFREQLSYLKQKGYVFYTMSEMIDILQNKKKIKRICVLTFDDGYRNVVTNAYPIMREFNSKGCFYLVSSVIESNKLLWTDFVETVVRNSDNGNFEFNFKENKICYSLSDKESYEDAIQDIKNKLRILPDKERIKHLKQFDISKSIDFPKEFILANWKEILRLDFNILEIGSHTKTHPNLTKLSSTREFEEEIKNSKAEIEKMIGYKIKHFCYPAGDYNEEIIERIKDYGYKSAVTISHGFNDESTNLYSLQRIESKEDFFEFKSAISGSFLAMYRIKEIFRRNK